MPNEFDAALSHFTPDPKALAEARKKRLKKADSYEQGYREGQQLREEQERAAKLQLQEQERLDNERAKAEAQQADLARKQRLAETERTYARAGRPTRTDAMGEIFPVDDDETWQRKQAEKKVAEDLKAQSRADAAFRKSEAVRLNQAETKLKAGLDDFDTAEAIGSQAVSAKASQIISLSQQIKHLSDNAVSEEDLAKLETIQQELYAARKEKELLENSERTIKVAKLNKEQELKPALNEIQQKRDVLPITTAPAIPKGAGVTLQNTVSTATPTPASADPERAAAVLRTQITVLREKGDFARADALERRLVNPAQWEAEQRAFRQTATPEQLVQTVEAGRADITEQWQATEQVHSVLSAQRLAYYDRLDRAKAKNDALLNQPYSDGDVAIIRDETTGEETRWHKAAAEEYNSALQGLNSWQQANQEKIDLLNLNQQQLQIEAANLDKHVNQLNYLGREQQRQKDGEQAAALNQWRKTPGMAEFADETERRSAEFKQRQAEIERKYAPLTAPTADETTVREDPAEFARKNESRALQKAAALRALQEEAKTSDISMQERMAAKEQNIATLYTDWAKDMNVTDWQSEDSVTPRLQQEAKARGLTEQEARKFLDFARKADWTRPLVGPASRGDMRGGKENGPVDIVSGIGSGLRALIDGKQPDEPSRNLPNGTLSINPDLHLDKNAYMQAVQDAPSSPQAKKLAREQFTKLHEIAGAQAVAGLENEAAILGLPDFNNWRAEKLQSAPDFARKTLGTQATEFIAEMKQRPALAKYTDTLIRKVAGGLAQTAAMINGATALVTGPLPGVGAFTAEAAGANLKLADMLSGQVGAKGGADTLGLRAGGLLAELVPQLLPMMAGGGLLAAGGKISPVVAAGIMGGVQTGGLQQASVYQNLRAQLNPETGKPYTHLEAWSRAAPGAIASGIVTGLLTTLGGKTGGEAALASMMTQAGREAARKALRESYKNVWATMKTITGHGIGEYLEEAPDELFSQISEEISTKGSSANLGKVIEGWLKIQPELMLAVTAMGSGAGTVGDLVNRKANQQALLAEDLAAAQVEIDNYEDATLDQTENDHRRNRAALALAIARGVGIDGIDEVILNSAGWTRKNPDGITRADGSLTKIKGYESQNVLDVDSEGRVKLDADYVKNLGAKNGMPTLAGLVSSKQTTWHKPGQIEEAEKQSSTTVNAQPQPPSTAPASPLSPAPAKPAPSAKPSSGEVGPRTPAGTSQTRGTSAQGAAPVTDLDTGGKTQAAASAVSGAAAASRYTDPSGVAAAVGKAVLPPGYTATPIISQYGEFSGKVNLTFEGKPIGHVTVDYDHSTNDVRINKSEIDKAHRGKGLAKTTYIAINDALLTHGLPPLRSDNRSLTEDAIRVWKSLEKDGLARQREDGVRGYEFTPSPAKQSTSSIQPGQRVQLPNRSIYRGRMATVEKIDNAGFASVTTDDGEKMIVRLDEVSPAPVSKPPAQPSPSLPVSQSPDSKEAISALLPTYSAGDPRPQRAWEIANHLEMAGLDRPTANQVAANAIRFQGIVGKTVNEQVTSKEFNTFLDEQGATGDRSTREGTEPLKIGLDQVTASTFSRTTASPAAAPVSKSPAKPSPVSKSSPARPEYATLRDRLKSKDISTVDAVREVMRLSGETDTGVLQDLLTDHLGLKKPSAAAAVETLRAAGELKGDKNDDISIASSKRASDRQAKPSDKAYTAAKEFVPATQGALAENPAWARAKLSMLARTPPARRRWAYRFLTHLENTISQRAGLYDAFAVGQTARQALEGNKIAVVSIQGKTTLAIDLDRMLADFSYLGDPRAAAVATVMEEDIHAAQKHLEKKGGKWSKAALRQQWRDLPDAVKKAVWQAYHNVKASDNQAMPRNWDNDTAYHMQSEFLRMLVQGRIDPKSITEAVDASPGLIQSIKDLLADLYDTLRSLIKGLPTSQAVTLDQQVTELKTALEQLGKPSTAEELRTKLFLRDPSAVAMQALKNGTVFDHLATQDALFTPQGLARVWDLLTPEMRAHVERLKLTAAPWLSKKRSDKAGLTRDLLTFLLDPRAAEALAQANLTASPTATTSTSMVRRALRAMSDYFGSKRPDFAQELSHLDLPTAQVLHQMQSLLVNARAQFEASALVQKLPTVTLPARTAINVDEPEYRQYLIRTAAESAQAMVDAWTGEAQKQAFIEAAVKAANDALPGVGDAIQQLAIARALAGRTWESVKARMEANMRASREGPPAPQPAQAPLLQSPAANSAQAIDEQRRAKAKALVDLRQQRRYARQQNSSPAAREALDRKLAQEQLAAGVLAVAANRERQYYRKADELTEDEIRQIETMLLVASDQLRLPETRAEERTMGFAKQAAFERLGIRFTPAPTASDADLKASSFAYTGPKAPVYVEGGRIIIKQSTLDDLAQRLPITRNQIRMSESEARAVLGLPPIATPNTAATVFEARVAEQQQQDTSKVTARLEQLEAQERAAEKTSEKPVPLIDPNADPKTGKLHRGERGDLISWLGDHGSLGWPDSKAGGEWDWFLDLLGDYYNPESSGRTKRKALRDSQGNVVGFKDAAAQGTKLGMTNTAKKMAREGNLTTPAAIVEYLIQEGVVTPAIPTEDGSPRNLSLHENIGDRTGIDAIEEAAREANHDLPDGIGNAVMTALDGREAARTNRQTDPERAAELQTLRFERDTRSGPVVVPAHELAPLSDDGPTFITARSLDGEMIPLEVASYEWQPIDPESAEADDYLEGHPAWRGADTGNPERLVITLRGSTYYGQQTIPGDTLLRVHDAGNTGIGMDLGDGKGDFVTDEEPETPVETENSEPSTNNNELETEVSTNPELEAAIYAELRKAGLLASSDRLRPAIRNAEGKIIVGRPGEGHYEIARRDWLSTLPGWQKEDLPEARKRFADELEEGGITFEQGFHSTRTGFINTQTATRYLPDRLRRQAFLEEGELNSDMVEFEDGIAMRENEATELPTWKEIPEQGLVTRFNDQLPPVRSQPLQFLINGTPTPATVTLSNTNTTIQPEGGNWKTEYHQAHRGGRTRRAAVEEIATTLLNPQSPFWSSLRNQNGDTIRPLASSARTTANRFYSQLARTVEAKMPNRADAKTLRGLLENPQNRIKAEELKWSGLLAWADSQPQPLTKQQVLNYLATEGSVQFEETRLSGDNTRDIRRSIEHAINVNPLVRRAMDDEGMSQLDAANLPAKLLDGRQKVSDLPQGLQRYAKDLLADHKRLAELGEEQRPTRNTQWTLPGGDNHREVVVTWKQKQPASDPEEYPKRADLVIESRPQEDDITGQPTGETEYVARYQGIAVGWGATEQQAAQRGIERAREMFELRRAPTPPNTPNSEGDPTHYGDLDALAWFRANDRDNGQGLLVEEFQSKWHQLGREKGYKGDPHYTIKPDDATPGMWSVRNQSGDVVSFAVSKDEAQRLADIQNKELGIPDAPYRSAWPLMLFKRALADAVAEGKQWIGWTTGDTQADRYDLSKQVDSIAWATTDGGKNYTLSIKRHGIELADSMDIPLEIPVGKLGDYIGKDAAQKIVSGGETGQLKGDGLKVGGEGMRKFYDDILVKEFGKYVKPWGGKVEQSSIVVRQQYKDPMFDIPESERARIERDAHAQVRREQPDLVLDDESDDYRDAVQEIITDESEAWAQKHRDEASTTPIWRIDITPAMRDSVSAGQALFASARHNFSPELVEEARAEMKANTTDPDYQGGNAWMTPDGRFINLDDNPHYVASGIVYDHGYGPAMAAGYVRVTREGPQMFAEFFGPLSRRIIRQVRDGAIEQQINPDDVVFEPFAEQHYGTSKYDEETGDPLFAADKLRDFADDTANDAYAAGDRSFYAYLQRMKRLLVMDDGFDAFKPYMRGSWTTLADKHGLPEVTRATAEADYFRLARQRQPGQSRPSGPTPRPTRPPEPANPDRTQAINLDDMAWGSGYQPGPTPEPWNTPPGRQKSPAPGGIPAAPAPTENSEPPTENLPPEGQTDFWGGANYDDYRLETRPVPEGSPMTANAIKSIAPYLISGNKGDLLGRHGNFYLDLVRRANRVLDVFGGAAIYTHFLAQQKALPAGSLWNEWEYSRSITNRQIKENPDKVIAELQGFATAFDKSFPTTETQPTHEATMEQRVRIHDWLNQRLEFALPVVPRDAMGRYPLPDTPRTAALYLFLQNNMAENRVVDFDLHDGKPRSFTGGKLNGKDDFAFIFWDNEKQAMKHNRPNRVWGADMPQIIRQASERLSNATVRQGDGWAAAAQAPEGSLVFVDTSYFPTDEQVSKKLGVMNYGGTTLGDAHPATWLSKFENYLLPRGDKVRYVVTNNFNGRVVDQLEKAGWTVLRTFRGSPKDPSHEFIALSPAAASDARLGTTPTRHYGPGGVPLSDRPVRPQSRGADEDQRGLPAGKPSQAGVRDPESGLPSPGPRARSVERTSTPLPEGAAPSALEIAQWDALQREQRDLEQQFDTLDDELGQAADEALGPYFDEDGTPLPSSDRQPTPGTWQMAEKMPLLTMPPAANRWDSVEALATAITKHGHSLFPNYPGKIEGIIGYAPGPVAWGIALPWRPTVVINGELINSLRTLGKINDAEAARQINATLLHEIIHQAENAVLADLYQKDTKRTAPWSKDKVTDQEWQQWSAWKSGLVGVIAQEINHTHPDLMRYSGSAYYKGRKTRKQAHPSSQLSELLRQFVEIALTGSVSEESPLATRFKGGNLNKNFSLPAAPTMEGVQMRPLHSALRFLARIVAKLKEWIGKGAPSSIADIVASMEAQVLAWQANPDARPMPVADRFGQYQLPLASSARTPTQTIEATGLAPAISVNGQAYTGRPGMFHGAILGDYVWRKVFTPQQRRDDPNQDNAVNYAYDTWMDSRRSGFDDFGFLDTRTGKFLTREEAYTLLTKRGFSTAKDSYSTTNESLDSIDLFNSTPTKNQEPGTKNLPASDRIAQAAQKTNTTPSEAQIEAENYQTGKVTVQGLRLSIENPRGSTRRGTDANGKAWEVTMPHHYGRILGTTGADKDHVDFFLGPDPTSPMAFVVNQKKPGNGHFDEHKVMLGFTHPGTAARGYLDSYSPGWRGYHSIVPMTLPQLKHWLEHGKMGEAVTKAPVVSNDTKPKATRPATTHTFADGYQLTGPGLHLLPASIRAYHGTPHEIDPKTGFSTSKIGTGEGAQVYGWGLYFAEAMKVAEQYRRTLSTPVLIIGDKEFTRREGADAFTEWAAKQLPKDWPHMAVSRFKEVLNRFHYDVTSFVAHPDEAADDARKVFEKFLRAAEVSNDVFEQAMTTLGNIVDYAEAPSPQDTTEGRWYARAIGWKPSIVRNSIAAAAFYDMFSRIGWYASTFQNAPSVLQTEYEQTIIAQNEELERFRSDPNFAQNKPQINAALDRIRIAETALSLLKDGRVKLLPNPRRGNFYTVDILGDPEQFLLWDEPLSKQSQFIRDAFTRHAGMPMTEAQKKAFTNLRLNGDVEARQAKHDAVLKQREAWFVQTKAKNNSDYAWDWPAEDQRRLEQWNNQLLELDKDIRGAYQGFGELYRQFTADSNGTPKDTSAFLAGMGIKGVRYLDGSSRSSGQGTHNYVIFDDKLVRILEKNGQPIDTPALASSDRQALPASPRQILDTTSRASFNHLDRWFTGAVARQAAKVTSSDPVTAATQAAAAWWNQDTPGVSTLRSLKELAQRELLPETVLPREIMSAMREMQIKQSMGQQKALDVGRALSDKPKFSDLHYPPEFVENPMHREQMFSAMEQGKVDTLPAALQEVARKLRQMLVEAGREAVKQGRMNPDTFEGLRTNFMPRFTKEEAQASAGDFAKRFKLGVKDILAQRSTAFHITDTSRKDKNGLPQIVSHAKGKWRFDSQQARDAYYEDLINRQTLDGELAKNDMHWMNRGDARALRGITPEMLKAPATMTKEQRDVVARVQRQLRNQFKKEDPYEPKDLVKDPVYAVMRYLAQMTHDNAVAEFFNVIDQNPDWTSSTEMKGFTQIPDNDRFGSLAGKYVRKDIADQVMELAHTPAQVIQLYDTLLRLWKTGKTVLNPATHARNIIGNLPFAQFAGNNALNPANWPHYAHALRTLRQGGDEYRQLYETGVLGADYASTELRAALENIVPVVQEDSADSPIKHLIALGNRAAQWGKAHSLANVATLGSVGATAGFIAAGPLGALAGAGIAAAANPIYRAALWAYRMEDDLFKAAAYFKARSMGMTKEQAAQHVRDWFPYYDKPTSTTLKFAGRTTMPFLSFFRESARIGAKAAKERPLSLAATLAIPTIITALSQAALGLEDEDMEDVKSGMRGKGAKLLGMTPLAGVPIFSMLIPWRTSSGQLQQIDLSSTHPMADFLANRVENWNNDPWWQAWSRSALANPMLGALYTAATGRDPFGDRTLWDSSYTADEKAKAILGHAWKTAMPPLAPGGTNWTMIDQSTRRQANKTLALRSPAQAVGRGVLGVDVRSADPDIYSLADAFRKRRGLPVTEGNTAYPTDAAGRARKALFDELVQPQPSPQALAKLLQTLNDLGKPVRTVADVLDILDYRRPDGVINPKELRAPFRASLAPEARRVLDTALKEFQRARAATPGAFAKARQQLKPTTRATITEP